MKLALLILGFFLLFNIVTYALFLAVMRLREMRDAGKLTFWPHPVRFVVGYIILFIGVLADVGLNLTWFTLLGRELPKRGEWLSTARLCRWFGTQQDGELITEWRRGVAKYYGDEFLNDADPDGAHVK